MSTDDDHGTGASRATDTGSTAPGASGGGPSHGAETPPAAPTAGAGAAARPAGATSTGSPRTAAGGRKKVDLAKNSRTARAWTAWIIGAVILIFLLVFIIQNADSTPVQFFAWEFSLPLGVTILLAAIVGALITALIGGARMLQMRRAARKGR